MRPCPSLWRTAVRVRWTRSCGPWVVQVTGPLFQPVNAEWGLLSDGVTAVMEMAQASGLPYIPEGKRNPRNTTSLGTGEMMAEALCRRAKKLLIATGEKTIEEVGMERFNLIVEVAGNRKQPWAKSTDSTISCAPSIPRRSPEKWLRV